MKRKSQSQMLKIIPLPEYKSNKAIVNCYKCSNAYLKTNMWKAEKINSPYLCDECKKGYTGKLVFKRAILSDVAT